MVKATKATEINSERKYTWEKMNVAYRAKRNSGDGEGLYVEVQIRHTPELLRKINADLFDGRGEVYETLNIQGENRGWALKLTGDDAHDLILKTNGGGGRRERTPEPTIFREG